MQIFQFLGLFFLQDCLLWSENPAIARYFWMLFFYQRGFLFSTSFFTSLVNFLG